MDRVKEITQRIYKFYGSDSGVLFGISPILRESVEAIIKITLRENESLNSREKEDEE